MNEQTEIVRPSRDERHVKENLVEALHHLESELDPQWLDWLDRIEVERDETRRPSLVPIFVA